MTTNYREAVMLIEMHAHTSEHSNCSRVRALDLIRLLHARGFEGLIFTDHHYLWQPEEIREIRRNSGVPEDFFVFSGQEVNTRDMGDVLVYGADRSVPQGSSLPEIRTLYPEAALVLAHPYRNGKNPAPGDLLSPLIDAVEIFNSNHTVSENRKRHSTRIWRTPATTCSLPLCGWQGFTTPGCNSRHRKSLLKERRNAFTNTFLTSKNAGTPTPGVPGPIFPLRTT